MAKEITKEMCRKAQQVLADNGVEVDETATVLQAIGYVLLDEELNVDWEFASKNDKETESKIITCTNCPYYYYDEDEECETCHHTDDNLPAPCEELEPEETLEYDGYYESYEEESWLYEDRNYNRLYSD